MYLSPVAMFEPILRDLQRMAAPDVDAETEAALCDSITQSVRNYRSLPDSKLTPSVLKKLIIEKKVYKQVCTATSAIAQSRPQSAAARTALFVLNEIVGSIIGVSSEAVENRLMEAVVAQGSQSQLLRHFTPLMAAATEQLQRLTTSPDPASSSGGGGSSNTAPPQAFVAAATEAFDNAGNLLSTWTGLSGMMADDAAQHAASTFSFLNVPGSAPAYLQLALTVLQTFSNLTSAQMFQIQMPRMRSDLPNDCGISSAVLRACDMSSFVVQAMRMGAVNSEDEGSESDSEETPHEVPAAVRELLLSEQYLRALAVCILAKSKACSAQFADGHAAAGAGSSSSSSRRGSSRTVRSNSVVAKWSYKDGLAELRSGRFVFDAAERQLLHLLEMSQAAAALAASVMNTGTQNVYVMWPLMDTLKRLCEYRDRFAAATGEQQQQVDAANTARTALEACMLPLLPHIALSCAADMPASHPHYMQLVKAALFASTAAIDRWYQLSIFRSMIRGNTSSSSSSSSSSDDDDGGGVVAASLEHQQQLTSMLGGVVPLLLELHAPLSEAVSAAAQIRVPRSQPRNHLCSCLEALARLSVLISAFVSFAAEMSHAASGNAGSSSGGDSGRSSASDDSGDNPGGSGSSTAAGSSGNRAMGVLQGFSSGILSILEGCMRQTAVLTTTAEGFPKELGEALVAQALIPVPSLCKPGSNSLHGKLGLLIGGAPLSTGSGGDTHKQLASLTCTLLKMVKTEGMNPGYLGLKGRIVASSAAATVAAGVLYSARAAVAADDSGCSAWLSSGSSGGGAEAPEGSANSGSNGAQQETAAAAVDDGNAQDAAAADTRAAAAAAVSVSLPHLVLIGRCLLYHSSEMIGEAPGLLQQLASGRKVQREDAPFAALCLFVGQEGTTWLQQVVTTPVLAWLRCEPIAAQLTSAGYDVAGLVQQLEQLLAARDVVAVAAAANHTTMAELVNQLQGVGSSLAAFATPCICNNPSCHNLSGPSESALVSGRSTICSSCVTARYCSKACQRVHWKAAHKPVCQALAAAAAAGGAGAG